MSKPAPPIDHRPRFNELNAKNRIPVQSVRAFVTDIAWSSKFENQKQSIDTDFDMAFELIERIKNKVDPDFFHEIYSKIQDAKALLKAGGCKDTASRVISGVCRYRWTHRRMLKTNAPNP